MQKQIMAYLETTKTVPENGYAIVSNGTSSYKMKLPKSTSDQKADYPVDSALSATSTNMVSNSAISTAYNEKEFLNFIANTGSTVTGVYVDNSVAYTVDWSIRLECPDSYSFGEPVYTTSGYLVNNSRGVDAKLNTLYVW